MSESFDGYRRWLGILPEERPANHYRLLGLSPFEADADVIDQAADRQMAHIERHRSGPYAAQCQAILNDLSAARLCLLRADTKAAYDEKLRSKLMAAGRQTPVAQATRTQPLGSASTGTASAARPLAVAVAVPASVAVATVGLDTDAQNTGASIAVGDEFETLAYAPASKPEISPTRRSKRSSSRSSNSVWLAPVAVTVACAAAGLAVWKWYPAASEEKPAAAAPPAKSAAQPVAGDSAAPSVHPAAPTAGENPAHVAVDLLALIKPERDTIDGRWTVESQSLTLADLPKNRHARLQIPYRPPAEYEIDMTVEREDHGSVILGLIYGPSQCVVEIDGWGNTASGLQLLDGKQLHQNATTVHGPLMMAGKNAELKCTVRRDRITVAVDGRQVIDWTGSPAQLSMYPAFAVPDKQALMLAGYNHGYSISKLKLTPLSGEGKVVVMRPVHVAAKQRASGGADDETSDDAGDDIRPNTSPVQPKTFNLGQPKVATAEGGIGKSRPILPADTDNLPAPPSEADRDEALKLVREVYADQYKVAKKPGEKVSLAEKLLAEAGKTDSPVEQFVLYSEARTQAAAGGSAPLVLQSAEELGVHFKIDVDTLIAETLEEMNRETLPALARKELAESVLPVANRQIEAENYSLAKRLLVIAAGAAKKANDKTLIKEINTRGNELKELRRGAEAIKTAEQTLENDPDDPEANLAKGRFLCFVKDDWLGGLPHLAKGSDAGLKALADLELAEPDSPEQQAKLADAWWALADELKPAETKSAEKPASEKSPGDKPASEKVSKDKAWYQARAGHWYAQAQPGLKGLAAAKAAKRLEELEGTAPKAKPSTTTAAAAAKPAPTTPSAAAATPEKTAASAAKAASAAAGKNLATRIKQAVKKDTLSRTRVGGTGGGNAYADMSDTGVLVGFNYTVLQRLSYSFLGSVQPIYLGQRGYVKGGVYGVPVGDVFTVQAKKGYAVAGVNLSAAFTYIYGFEVVFNAVDAGGTLNPKDSYTSDWQGTGQQYVRTDVANNGQSIIGIFGQGGDYITSIGFVQLPKQQP